MSTLSQKTLVQKDKAPSSPKASHKNAFFESGKPFLLFSTLPYYFLCFLYWLGYLSLKYYQNPYWVLALVFFAIPIMDYFSHDWLNPTPEQYKELEQSFWFKIPLFVLVVVDNTIFFWAIHFMSTNSFSWLFYPGAIFLIGAVAGSNFLIAHELFHKKGAFNKVIGSLTMAKSLYMHFYIEHNYGHHKNVATPLDPASANFGDSIYQYFPKTIIGGYKSAWNIEKKRLLQRENHKTHWVLQNKMLWFALNNIIFPVVVFNLFGLKGLCLYLAMALVSVLILETINYIEHYGLRREKIGPNEYERVTIKHSWNAPQRFSNYLLFKLQRHSDHHENAYKPYQVLSSKDESPMLPHGYTMCIILAFFPSSWLKMMEISLKTFQEGREPTKEEKEVTTKETRKAFSWLGLFFITILIANSYLKL